MELGLVFGMSVPGLVWGLILLTALERVLVVWAGGRSWLPWRRGNGSTMPVSAAGFEELGGLFSGGKRLELDDRKSQSMMRDEEDDGAPPHSRVDLDKGVATIRLPRSSRETGESGRRARHEGN